MLYNSTYYRTTDLETIVNAVYSTLAIMAPQGKVKLGLGSYFTSDLRYHVPARVIVGYAKGPTTHCTVGSDTAMARETLFVHLPSRKHLYTSDLEMLGNIGLYPHVVILMTAIAFWSISTQARKGNAMWINALPEQHRIGSPWAGVALYTHELNPEMELHIEKKASIADVRACREQRALLDREDVESLMVTRVSRLRRAEWYLEYARKGVERSETMKNNVMARLAKYGGSNG